MIIHISTDRILFFHGAKRVELPYGELEKHISAFLYTHIPAVAGPDQRSGNIVVINGPGSFTNLRIVTLALNTYNFLHGFAYDFVNIDKISWYAQEYIKGHVKQYCLMYIGQKKNFWLVDLGIKHDNGCLDSTSLRSTGHALDSSLHLEGHDIPQHEYEGIRKVHVEELKNVCDMLGDNWFVDEMVAEGKEMMDAVFGVGGYHMYTFVDSDGSGVGGSQTQLLEPNYMIDANVSK